MSSSNGIGDTKGKTGMKKIHRVMGKTTLGDESWWLGRAL